MPWEHQISPDHDDFNTPPNIMQTNVNALEGGIGFDETP
jgi:hypothetical protein